MSAGKGDRFRPVNVTVFGENYDRVFRKKTQCRKCGGILQEGIAMRQTFVGHPDFPGDTGTEAGCTITYGGPGKLGPCMKCHECGHSFTAPAPAPAPATTFEP